MKTLTVRVPDALAAQLDAEATRRRVSKSDIVRERLQDQSSRREAKTTFDAIGDLIGSVDGLPTDLSARKKDHLKASRYGRKRSR
jgi:Arc/MetJ-type ribon-helix-helix transcriptional regulator